MAVVRSSFHSVTRLLVGALLGVLVLDHVCPAAAREICDTVAGDAPQAPSLMQVRKNTQLHKQEGHRRTTPKLNISKAKQAPCQCHANDPSWTPPAARKPRCVFIDLGAADGNTFRDFLADGYGPLHNCPSGGAWEAVLVEANPHFANPLAAVQQNYSDVVGAKSSTAAYMCEGNTSFFLDTVDVDTNFWGSSLSPNHQDVIRSGRQQVTVPLVNVMRLIFESTLPEDYVLLKMDIEGAEHDILPCLAQSNSLKLVDALFLEHHPVEWALGSSDVNATLNAVETIKAQGVWVPDYHSATL